MTARAQRRANLGEELVIFGNPARTTATRAEAEKAKTEMEARGYQVSLHPMHGGTFTVLATKKSKASRNAANPKRGRRRNQVEDEALSVPADERVNDTDQAVSLFQKFHGKEPEEVLELQRSAAMRLDYTALGDLRAIGLGAATLHGTELVHHWEKLSSVDFDGDGVKLASAPNGKQLYLIGGNQDLSGSITDFEGVDPEKDLIDLGEAGFVVYDARKKHSNFEPVEWVHEFGEENGTLPRLVYDRLKQEVFFVGGEYFIDLAQELSPGIEN